MTRTRAGVGTAKRPSRLAIFAAFAAVYVIWGSTYLGIKYAIETLPSFLMAGGRFLMAGTVLIAIARFSGTERITSAHWRSAAIIGAFLFLGGNGGVVWAEHYIASGLAALLVATEPLWIVLLNWLRPQGVRPNWKTMLGLLTGFVGVWLLIGTSVLTSGETSMLGVGLVIASAFSWAIGSLYSLDARLPTSPLLAAGMQMTCGGLLLTLAGTLAGEWTQLDLRQVSAVSAGAFFYLVFFGSIVAFTAYSWLLRIVTPARAATYAYVNPVVAVLLGWSLAGEQLTARMAVAAAVIVTSVALITSYGKKKVLPRKDSTQTGVPGGVEPGGQVSVIICAPRKA